MDRKHGQGFRRHDAAYRQYADAVIGRLSASALFHIGKRRARQQTLPTGIMVFIVNQKQDISDTLGLVAGCFFVFILFLDICGVALSYFNSIREQNSNFRQEQMK